MTSHPWICRILVLVLLASAYAIGVANGRLLEPDRPTCRTRIYL
jgi:hypothetical protein